MTIAKKQLRIMSNMPELDLVELSNVEIVHEVMNPNWSYFGIFKELIKAHKYQVVLINATPQRLILFCIFSLFSIHRKWKLISHDQNLIAPESLYERAVAMFKRYLFTKVDYFILHLRDSNGYRKYYGIPPDRVIYIPFKVNIWELVGDPKKLSSDGEYVLVGGRSLRDLNTFIEAMKILKFPSVILHQGIEKMNQHGTEINLNNLPNYIKAVYHDGNQHTWAEFIRKARVVVIPTFPTITAAGVSVYLDAMSLKKCVILSDNPASRGILKEEAIIVPPQNSTRLAEEISNVWENSEYRENIASKGLEYANNLKDKKRLLKDIIECCGRLA